MSDTVVIAVVTAICTALPLVLAQVVNILKTTKKMDDIDQKIDANAATRKTQNQAVQAAIADVKTAAVKLEEGHNYLAQAMATNAYSTEALKRMMERQSGFGELNGTKS